MTTVYRLALVAVLATAVGLGCDKVEPVAKSGAVAGKGAEAVNGTKPEAHKAEVEARKAEAEARKAEAEARKAEAEASVIVAKAKLVQAQIAAAKVAEAKVDAAKPSQPVVAEQVPPVPVAKPVDPKSVVLTTPTPAPKPLDTSPGPTLFGVSKLGVVALDGGQFARRFAQPDSFKDMVVAPDGTIYVAAYSGIHKVGKDGKALKIGSYDSPGSMDHLALAPDGSLWAAGYKSIAQYVGGTWTTVAKKSAAPGATVIKDIAVDSQGGVWVLSSAAIHKREGGTWKTLQAKNPNGQQLFLDGIAFGADGAAYICHSSGLLKYQNGEFSVVELGFRPFGMREIVVGSDGTLAVRAYRYIVTISPKGAITRFSPKDGHFMAKHISSLDVDSTGRVWAVTDAGVVIIDRAGKVTQWLQGTISELAGSVQAIIVMRGGPTLPKVGAVKLGKITGKLVHKGKPVAGASVQMCGRPSSIFSGTPCTDAPWKAEVKSGPDGGFAFDKVPLGSYKFAVKAGEKWSTQWTEYGAGMKEGKTLDVGAVEVRKL